MTTIHAERSTAHQSAPPQRPRAANPPGANGQRSKFRNKWVAVAITGIAASGVILGLLVADADGIASGILGGTDKNGNPQHVGERGMEAIMEYEGLELTGYVLGDGKCTIGYGHAVDIALKPAAECQAWHITQEEAEAFLYEDTEYFANSINDYFCRSFTQNQFDALVSFSYNVGEAFKKYDWACDAPDDYFPGIMIQYVNPVKFREGLTRRRKAEIAVFENPVDLVPVAAAVEPQTAAITPRTAQAPTSDVPTVYYTPGATDNQTPIPVSTWPAIQPLFKGAISER